MTAVFISDWTPTFFCAGLLIGQVIALLRTIRERKQVSALLDMVEAQNAEVKRFLAKDQAMVETLGSDPIERRRSKAQWN